MHKICQSTSWDRVTAKENSVMKQKESMEIVAMETQKTGRQNDYVINVMYSNFGIFPSFWNKYLVM